MQYILQRKTQKIATFQDPQHIHQLQESLQQGTFYRSYHLKSNRESCTEAELLDM